MVLQGTSGGRRGDRFDPASTLRDEKGEPVKLAAAEAARISGQSDEGDMLWTPETRPPRYVLTSEP